MTPIYGLKNGQIKSLDIIPSYVLVVKFSRGDYVLVVKFMGGGGGGGGDFVHVYKNEQGGFVRGDYVRIPVACIFDAINRLLTH